MWDFPLTPDAASSVAPRVDEVFYGLVLMSVAFVLFFTSGLIFFAIKYRKGSSADRSNPVYSNSKAEAIFITIPTLLGIGIFVWSTIVYFDLIDPPGDAIDIYVTGKQWMWKVQHPEGSSEINDLHVPVGQPIRLLMTSEDVIHSYFLPAFRLKQDVLPGRTTTLWFRPTKVGRYRIFCAEYCGSEHSRMGGWMTVMEPSDYERWLEQGSNANTAMASEGERLFRQYHCSGCHGGDSTSGERAVVRAPNLEGVYGGPVPILEEGDKTPRIIQADERYIRDSILLPNTQVVAGYEALMPSFAGQISEDDLFKILAYIKSIGRGSQRRPAIDRGEKVGEDSAADIANRMGGRR